MPPFFITEFVTTKMKTYNKQYFLNMRLPFMSGTGKLFLKSTSTVNI